MSRFLHLDESVYPQTASLLLFHADKLIGSRVHNDIKIGFVGALTEDYVPHQHGTASLPAQRVVHREVCVLLEQGCTPVFLGSFESLVRVELQVHKLERLG